MRKKRHISIFAIPLIASTARAAASQLRAIYGTSANEFNGSLRGWNSYGLQSREGTSFVLNQNDSGNGGDEFGRLVPDTSLFPNLTALADHLHSQGKLLGIYALPGAFSGDADITIKETNIKLGTLQAFDFSKDGMQQWHNSVVNNWSILGFDYIKLDCMTPRSPQAVENLPANNALAAVAYHKAIQQASRPMRLDLSWKLDRNSASDFFFFGATVQRAIEQYRSFINQQEEDPARQGTPIMVRPDMDNMYTGNGQTLTGLSDVGAGANLITGSDLSQLDTLGKELLSDSEFLSVAVFTAQYPMQLKIPVWHYEPGSGQGGFGKSLQGVQLVNISLSLLGIAECQPNGAPGWIVRRVLGGGSGGPDHSDLGVATSVLTSNLGPGESILYYLTATD
ncbi:glycoside hydrolase family 27 protein [Trichoderma austrokoningii]